MRSAFSPTVERYAAVGQASRRIEGDSNYLLVLAVAFPNRRTKRAELT